MVSRSPGAARPRAAVVGAGVAGLTAAYVLQRAYRRHAVSRRTTGSAATPTPTTCRSRRPTLGVDTGFIVHNAAPIPASSACSPSSASTPATPK